MNHIELFAGCGGLSLGLSSVDFQLLLANELSPMAAETFAYNLLGENLSAPVSELKPLAESRVKWLASAYDRSQMQARLREDPRTVRPVSESPSSDVSDATELNRSLVIGSIVELNRFLNDNKSVLRALKRGFNGEGVDLVSGGPPCQSFSMAGMREYGNARNNLPWEFASFVGMVKPRMALLENVTGILRPFTVKGKKIHAWFEVAKAFVEKGYVPLCLHVNAKFAGVAQNRPRFLMLSFREDVYEGLSRKIVDEQERAVLARAGRLYVALKEDPSLNYSSEWAPLDAANEKHLPLFRNTFLQPLVEFTGDRAPYTVHQAIDDLAGPRRQRSSYVDDLDRYFPKFALPSGNPENYHPRHNSALVQRRFKLYQNLQRINQRSVRIEVQALLSGRSDTLSDESTKQLCRYAYVSEEAITKTIKFSAREKQALIDYIVRHGTKKQTQKALDAHSPAPAALSIPDDACHYEQLRCLTVREMARIQSFPDGFFFRSKVTTGGQSRKFEVPQYTQVGNAVPPVLGRAIGLVLRDLLTRLALAETATTKRATEALEYIAEAA